MGQTLAQYTTNTRILIRDSSSQAVSATILTNMINQARIKTAERGECIRIRASGGTISAVTVTAGGTLYSSTPTITASGGLGQSAIFTATVVAGVITAITVVDGGFNFTGTVTVTITDSTGSGAIATATINTSMNTVPNQQIYPFSLLNSTVQLTTGVDKILKVLDVAVSNGSTKPVLYQLDWQNYQAQCNVYPQQYGNVAIWAQFGFGDNGSIYLYPIPSQAWEMDWDCVCLPIAIDNSSTAAQDAIPYPWSEAVPYYAAYLYYEYAQRDEDAKDFYAKWLMRLQTSRASTEGGGVPSYY